MDDYLDFIESEQQQRYGCLETGGYQCTLKRIRFYETPFRKAKLFLEYDGEMYVAEAPLTKRDGSNNMRSVRIVTNILTSNSRLVEEAKKLRDEYKKKNITRIPTEDVLSTKELDLNVFVTIETKRNDKYVNSYVIDLRVLS